MIAGFYIKDGVLVKYTGEETKVMIPDGIVKIGEAAFCNNRSITEITMPDSVIKIGSNAFKECVNLKVVSFSKKIESIEYEAFYCCKALKEVLLPDTLRVLGSDCFAGCKQLSSITCSSKDIELGSNPFGEDESDMIPTEIADKDGFIILAGILYCYVGGSKRIAVPDGVTHIAKRLFRTYDIEEVILPNSVKYIGSEAFLDCKKLKSITMPSNIEIGKNAFNGCDKLVDNNGFFIHDGVAYAYCGKRKIVNVPVGTKIITSELFANTDYNSNKGHENIQKVILPDGLEVIGAQAFAGCSSLEEISIPESVHTIGDAAFRNCEHLKNFNIPNTVENIGDNILSGCRGIADDNGFVIANNSIQAFYGTERNIVVPEGIVAIADGAFDNTSIYRIKLPSTLKKLGSAFENCVLLEEIIIPEGLTEIRGSTFSNCKFLGKVVLPPTIERIGNYAFYDCKSVTKMVVPSGVKKIGNSAFRYCNNLVELVLPEGLDEISNCAFMGCENLLAVVIPSTVRKIESHAFADCTALQHLTFLSTEAEISSSAFDNCPQLRDKDGFTIINNTVYKYEGDGRNVVVPEGVTAIADSVFREEESLSSCKEYRRRWALKQITLPSTLRKIGDRAFYGCKKLNEIIIPDSVTSIGEEAFRNCNKLSSVMLSAELVEIGPSALNGCESLERIFIPSKVTYIGADAFGACKRLKCITVEECNSTYSSLDGMLMNKCGDTILFVPAAMKYAEYVVPSCVKTISARAFIECNYLKKIVIPASVENIGDEAFPRKGWNGKSNLTDIEVDPKAGKGKIGVEVFDICEWRNPIVYPKLPVEFVKERKTHVCLALGFCLNPEKYEGEYAELYRKFITSNERTLIVTARKLNLKGIEEYFARANNNEDYSVEEKSVNGYKPDLSIKNPSEIKKVELLEEVVQKGTLKDVSDVLETYKTFEMTARALGLAARYRGVEFVKLLVDHGATFEYKYDSAFQRKYKMIQNTSGAPYYTEYYLMVVPEKLDLSKTFWGGTAYDYSAMCGIQYMNISSDMVPLSLEKRIEVVKYLAGIKKVKISLDEMLFWALTRDELDFADDLIEMGVTLQETPPSYFDSWGKVPTYLEMVTSAPRSEYWNLYVKRLASLNPSRVLPVLERLGRLATVAGKKLAVSQKMFDEIKWCDESFAYVVKNADMSRINKKIAMEMAVSTNSLGALEKMAEDRWLINVKNLECLIDFARMNKHKEALAWLMDFKNKNVDIAKEELKAEEKMMKELSEDPNSVSTLKRKWSYLKLDNGTLQITSYKGDEEEIEIPAVIGKARVTSIGKKAFSICMQKIKNVDSRTKIKSVVIPNGITAIGDEAFLNCKSIEIIKMPNSVKKIGREAFSGCSRLKEITLPNGVWLGENSFFGCKSFYNKYGYMIIGDILVGYKYLYENNSKIVIPNGVVTIAGGAFVMDDYHASNICWEEVVLPDGLVNIGEGAFDNVRFKKINIPNSVKSIGKKAFKDNDKLTSIILPEGLTSIGVSAFEGTEITELKIPKSVKFLPAKVLYRCAKLRDVYIPDTVEKISSDLFGKERERWRKTGVYVHTPAGSAAEEYLKDLDGIHVLNDYVK